MSSLAQKIPGLQQHRSQVRAPQYPHSEAKHLVDRVLFWMADNVPNNQPDWLQEHEHDQHKKIMKQWKEIDICDQNQDIAGVKAACAAMVLEMQRGVAMRNQAPVVVDAQLALI